MKTKKYRQGYFIEIGIAFGIPIGIILAVSIGNMGLVAIGVPIGLSVGIAIEEKYKKQEKILHLTKEDKHQRKIAFIISATIFIILLVLGLILLI